jgi:hypothetical protein
MASRTTWLGGKPMLYLPRRGFFSEIVTQLGGGYVIGGNSRRLKNGETAKVAGGKPLF